MSNIITIGSATMDVFVECDDARIVSVATKDSKTDFMAYPYGSKLEINDFASCVGGGGINTASNFANLGYDTGAIFKIGEDVYSEGILATLAQRKIDISNLIQNPNTSTGFSIILVSFQGDRTVLAHRGANAKIKKSEINFDAIKKAKFIYIAPLSGESNRILDDIAFFAREHGVKICFNAGSTSIKKGFDFLKKIIDTAQIVVMNKEEASMTTKIEVRPDSKEEKFSNSVIHPDICSMLKKLKVNDTQIIVITDGKNGVYAYNGQNFYQCDSYPSEVVSTLGAGDAFASTFCAAMDRTDYDIGKSLIYAAINSASVVSKFGATEGLLTFEQIEDEINSHKEFTYKVL